MIFWDPKQVSAPIHKARLNRPNEMLKAHEAYDHDFESGCVVESYVD